MGWSGLRSDFLLSPYLSLMTIGGEQVFCEWVLLVMKVFLRLRDVFIG